MRLQLRETEVRHEAHTGLGRVFRPANQGDDGVEVVEGDLQAFEDVRTRLGLAQLKLDTPPHHFLAELDEQLDDLQQVQHTRPAAGDGQQRDAVAHLQLGVFVEIIEHHVRQFAALEFDHDSHAIAIRLVTQIRNAFELLVAHERGRVGDQGGFIDLVRNLGDDDRHAIALLVFFEGRFATHHDAAAAFAIRAMDAGATDDGAA